MLLFGSGGRLLDFYKDRALALPPLNMTLARRVMEQTNVYTALEKMRRNFDLTVLEQILVNFSLLVVEQRWIKEIDVNPLLVTPERVLALDARVVLHGPGIAARIASRTRHPPLSDTVCRPMDDAGRNSSDDSSHPAGR